jgi:GNAT superfamily N-acetyltransferase
MSGWRCKAWQSVVEQWSAVMKSMVRKAITSDILGIRALMQSVPGHWQQSWCDMTIATALNSAHGLAFVWEENSLILGFVCAHDLGFRGYLSELVVEKSARRHGVATRLVRAIEEVLARRGQQVVISDAWQEAEPFYRSLGWDPPNAILLRQRLKQRD